MTRQPAPTLAQAIRADSKPGGRYTARMTLRPLPDRPIGAAVRRWRALNRVKQEDLARRLGVAQTTLSRWEAGRTRPCPAMSARLRDLLSARPSSAADAALVSLVRQSRAQVHLICDLSHRLIAASPARLAEWRLTEGEARGLTLWPFATEEIAAAEWRIAADGWFERASAEFRYATGAALRGRVAIPAGGVRITRLPLADGGFARLVERAAPA